MLKTRASILAAAVFSLSFAAATPVDAQITARQGFVFCGGNNFLGGPFVNNQPTEIQIFRLNLRNFDGHQPVTITGLRIYTAPGAILFDSAVSGLPAFANGILGPANNILGPQQSSTLFSETFLPFLAQNDRPLQIILTWTSAAPTMPLVVGEQTIVRQRDPVTGAQLAERTRSSGGCRELLN